MPTRTALVALLALAVASPWLSPRACAAAAATTPDTAPLDRYVATLDTTSLDDAPRLQAALRAAEAQLARAEPPRSACAEALGAERHAGLYVAVGRARQALGDRAGARAAWQAAIDCAPRVARHRLGLATVLLTLGELDAADATLARARQLSPDGPDPYLEQVQARIDYAAARWSTAATGAARVVELLQVSRATLELAADAARTPRTLPAPADDASPDVEDDVLAFWRILELLARRRGGQAPDATQLTAPDLVGAPWPGPLWRHLHGELDEAGLVAWIRAADSPRRRREMSCEALYYTAQQAFAAGDEALARRRLARVVNLKVPYFIEHELALAELARLRRGP